MVILKLTKSKGEVKLSDFSVSGIVHDIKGGSSAWGDGSGERGHENRDIDLCIFPVLVEISSRLFSLDLDLQVNAQVFHQADLLLKNTSRLECNSICFDRNKPNVKKFSGLLWESPFNNMDYWLFITVYQYEVMLYKYSILFINMK